MTKAPGVRSLIQLAISDGVPLCALKVAIVVGFALNAINQGDVLFSGAELNVTKALLTFLVPYLVSTHGAVSARLRHAGVKPRRLD